MKMAGKSEPNADLIGLEFTVEDGRAEVTGTASWSGEQYVTIAVERENGTRYVSVRLADHVRNLGLSPQESTLETCSPMQPEEEAVPQSRQPWRTFSPGTLGGRHVGGC